MNLYHQTGKRIRYLRVQRGWSQLTLALEANINPNYLSDLERGRRNPSLKVLGQLTDALGVDLSSLFKGIKTIE